MKTVRYLFTVCVLVWLQGICYGQVKKDTLPPYIKGKVVLGERVLDTLPPNADSLHGRKKASDRSHRSDSTVKKKHDPHKATLYSTFCPGLGQIYNRKYWKLPLVYAAVGIPVYTYFYNRDWYKKCQYALLVALSPNPSQDSINKVDTKLKNLVTGPYRSDAAIRTYRNEFRKDQDYSVIFFLLFWGLQIVDATVDAHLMNFDISPELSLHFRDGSGSTGNALIPGSASPAGIGLAFDIHKARYRPIALP